MSARPSALAYPSVDDKLGDRATRFFGEGFKRVTHALTHVSVTPATGTVEATAGLSLPGTWSQKGRAKQRPHLSTIDVMLLAAQLTGLYTGHTFDHEPTRFVILSVKIRAGARPDEDGLEQFPVHAVHRSTTDAPDGEQITTMDCRIGGMTVTVTAAHPAGIPVDAPGFYAQAGHLPGAWNDRPYGVDHHTQAQLLTDVHADVADLRASARLELTGKGVFTAIDLFVSALQLSQVLLYNLDGVDRAYSNTLWMRRTDITISKGPDAYRAYVAQRFAVTLEKVQELPTKQGTWRTARIRADHAGLSLTCDVTHLLP